jgi:hypothetical protein
MGPVGCAETSVRNYHSTLCKMPQEGSSHLHCGGILKYPLFVSNFSQPFKLHTEFLRPPNMNFNDNIFGVLKLLHVTQRT